MDSSLGKGSYAEYRAQLLRRALEEKKKLGLDGIQASVKPSSALQALRCYGLESSDSVSFGEPEENISSSRPNERRKTIDLHSKQTTVASPYSEKRLFSPNSFSSGDKNDNKPFKSILKRTERPPDSSVANKQHSPINTPFFLNNAENEDEFLYGKSINEQSLRVSALYAESKSNSKSSVIDLKVQNWETSVNSSDNGKGQVSVVDLGAQDPKAPNLFGGSKNKSIAIDLFAQDSKTPRSSSGNSKSKSNMVDFDALNSKTSSNLSGYAALLSFSKGGLKNIQKTNNVSVSGSSQKDATSRENKPSNSKPAASLNNSVSANLCSPDKKIPETRCIGDKNSAAPSSNPTQVCKSKPVARLLPRSIQKLQTKKSVDQSVERKDSSSETTAWKASDKDTSHNSLGNVLSKSSENAKKCDVKPAPKNVDTSLKNDEMLLLKYVHRTVRSSGEKVKSGPVTKPITDSINSDSKPTVKNPVQEIGSSSGEKVKSSSATPIVGSINSDSKSVVSASPATQVTDSSCGREIKSDPVTEPMSGGIQKCDLKPLSDTIASLKGKAVSEEHKEIHSPNKKKDFLSKFSSIKQKKKNFPFLYHGKRPLPKGFLPKRYLKRPRSSFDHNEYDQTAKGKGFSREKHTFDCGSGKTAYVGREVSNKRAYKGSSYSSGPEMNVAEGSFHSYDFSHEKEIGVNSRVHSTGRTPALQKSDEIGISSYDKSFRGVTPKNTGKYDYFNPDKLPIDRNALVYTKKGRHGSRSDLSSKRETFYMGFDRNPDRYSVENSPQRHSSDWSPPRNEFHNSPRRRSLDHSPGRYSFDDSPSRQLLDRRPLKHQFNESLGSCPFDRSPSPRSFSRSPDSYSYGRSPGPHPYDRSPGPHPYDRSPGAHPYDRSPGAHPYDRSPEQDSYDRSPDRHSYDSSVPFLYDRSPSPHPYARSPSPHHYDRSFDSHPYDRSPRLRSYDGSPESGSHDMNSGRHLQEMSPRRRGFDRRHRLHSFDNSPERLSVEKSPRRLSGERGSGRLSVDMSPRRLSLDRSPGQLSLDRSPRRLSIDRSPRRLSIDRSPRRLSTDRSPRRLSTDRSPRRLSHDRSPRRLSIDRSSGRFSAELSPRRVPFDRPSRNNSFDRSPRRFRKSRIDCYHGSSGRISCRNPCKESHDNLKYPHSQSPEVVLHDSSDRLSERSLKSNHSSLSQNLSTRAPLARQQLDLINNTCAEEYSNRSLETKIPSSLGGISQQQDLQNILGIPDVNKIVNAIDTLASNYSKCAANEKDYGITRGRSFQSFDSTLPIPCSQDSAQLTTPSATLPSYQRSCYNQANNNPQVGYNSEIPQGSYPPYNISSESYSSQYRAFQQQPSGSASLYPASTSTFQSTGGVASPSYSNASAVLPPFSSASVQPPFSSATVQVAPFSSASVVSTTFSGGNAVPTLSTTSLLQPLFSAAYELSEMFPAAEPSYIANDGSLERVSTLTAVPLQSDVSPDKLAKKNANKSQSSSSSVATMKFITPDKIEKLLRQKSDIRKQMAGLNNEYAKLQKMQGDAMRRKRREKDGHKDILLLEYGRLQDEIKSHLNNLVEEIKDIEQELKNGFLGCTSEKVPKTECPTSVGDNEKESGKSGECIEEMEESSNYEFHDSGSHWCKHCNKLCTTMSGMLEHLKSDEHLELTNLIDKPWVSKSSSDKATKSEQRGRKITKPIKGVQFVMPVDGFYCSLCTEYFDKNSHIQEHLKGSRHYETYLNYTTANPAYERRWLLDRLAALSVIEIEEKRFSEEEMHLQKKQKRDKEEKLKCKKEDEEKVRQMDMDGEEEKFRKDNEQFRQKEKEERLRQKEEEEMNMKEKFKHKKEEERKRCSVEEEEQTNDDENLNRRMEVVEKLIRREEERENLKRTIEQREKMRHREEEEKKWRMNCRKQEEKLKRQKDEEKPANNKKLKTANAADKDTLSTCEAESTEVINKQPVEKLSKAEPKWALCDGQKKLPSGNVSESKNKPKQTFVYIGRAPNFKSYNKGNSSFRANLLKLALQKKEAENNSNKGNELTSSGSGANGDHDISSPVNTSSHELENRSSEQGTFPQRSGGNIESVSDGINASSTSSSLCGADQIVPSKSLAKNETNSNFDQQNCFGIISNPQESNYSSTNNTESLHKKVMTYASTSQQNISASSNVEAYSSISTDFRQNQASVPISTVGNLPNVSENSFCSAVEYESFNTQHIKETISPCVPAVTNLTNNLVNHNLSLKFGSENSLEQRKAKRQVPVHGPLTEEDEDLFLLGINREDRLPLVLPKPPPAALIWSCHKDDKNASGKVSCDETAIVVSDSDVSEVQQSQTDAQGVDSSQNHNASCSPDTQPITNTAQAISSPSEVPTSQQSYGSIYDVSMAQQLNVNYLQNVQQNFAASYQSVNCSNASSVQQSYNYPYNSNVSNVTNFQGNFIMHSESVNNVISPFPAAQVPPPGQFQNLTPCMEYPYQGAPPGCYNKNSRNFYYGRYPQSQFPPPNVNPCQNYCPPRFQRRRRARRSSRPACKKKWQFKQNQTRQDMGSTEEPVNAEKKMTSPVETEKPPADSIINMKLLSHKTVGVEGCVANNLPETATKGDAPLTASTSENGESSSSSDRNAVVKLENIEISEIVEGSGCDISNHAELEKCNVIEQNKVSIQSVPTFDLEVSSGHANVHSAKLKRNVLSPVAKLDDSQQPLSFDASAVVTETPTSTMLGIPDSSLCENSMNGTEVKVDQGIVKKYTDSFTVEQMQSCESTDHVPPVSDAVSCGTCQDTSQQNQLSELEYGEGNQSFESEEHVVSSSTKSQEKSCDTDNHCQEMNADNENSDTDEYDAEN